MGSSPPENIDPALFKMSPSIPCRALAFLEAICTGFGDDGSGKSGQTNNLSQQHSKKVQVIFY